MCTPSNDEFTAKIILIGDPRVGKTSLCNRYFNSTFNENQSVTFPRQDFKCERQYDLGVVTMNVWDTAGQEDFKSVVPLYFKNSSAGICVFDINNEESFENIKERINEFLHVTKSSNNFKVPIIFLVGNKNDLNEWKAKESLVNKAEQYARNQNAQFILTSAKTGENVDQLFQSVFDEVYAQKKICTPDGVALNPDVPPKKVVVINSYQ